MHPKFVLVSLPSSPRVGTFVYGLVGQHEELVRNFEEQFGYVRTRGGGWYEKDDEARTMILYGCSCDFGEPRLAFLNRFPAELKGYKFYFRLGPGIPMNELDLTDVEWF